MFLKRDLFSVKSLGLGYSILFILTFLSGYSSAFGITCYPLSNDPNQHFDNAITSWMVTNSDPSGTGTVFSLGVLTNNTTNPDNLNLGETSPLTTGYTNASQDCEDCGVTLTYTDPHPGTAATVQSTQSFIELDVYTANIGRKMDITVIDTSGAVTAVTDNDLVYNCAVSGILAGSTIANTWSTIFVDVSGLTHPVSLVQVIIPSGFADEMDSNLVYMDNLRWSGTLPCIVPPTPTFTYTVTETPTKTNTPTITPTPTNTDTFTPTLSPTNTPTPPPTNTFTQTPTQTDSPTATLSPTQTPTLTQTPTGTWTPPFTSTFTGTPTVTNTYTYTYTWTSTPTFTNTFTYTYTYTPTYTYTNTFTNTYTYTFTYTPTITDTPTNTFTITPTGTFTMTPPPTQTPCPIYIYPNPMDFQASPPNNHLPSGTLGSCGSHGCIKFACVPVGSTLKIYTIKLELVKVLNSTDPSVFLISSNLNLGTFIWDGTNGDSNPVSSGFYLYLIEGPNGSKQFGKIAISRSRNGA